MSFKEVSCTILQFIYNDILESFETKGIFAQLHGPSLAVLPRILFLCRFPGVVNTERFSRNLFVVGEDEFQNIYVAVSGKHPFDISILFSSLSLMFYDWYLIVRIRFRKFLSKLGFPLAVSLATASGPKTLLLHLSLADLPRYSPSISCQLSLVLSCQSGMSMKETVCAFLQSVYKLDNPCRDT